MKKISRMVITVMVTGTVLAGCGANSLVDANNADVSTAELEEIPASQDENAQDEEAGMANPWKECSEEEAKAECPRLFKAPQGAESIHWSIMESAADEKENQGALLQLNFTLDGSDFCARAQYGVDEQTAIHGMHYEWDASDETTLANWGEGHMQATCYRAIDDVGTVDLITWYDIEIGISYSLSVSAEDLDGFDIRAIAEQMYDASTHVWADDAADTAPSDTYAAFIEGSAKAKYRGTGDRTQYLNMAGILEKDSFYSMDEIVAALKSADEYMEYKLAADIEYSRIDCGQDGVEELLVTAPFEASEIFTLYMIIKEIDGELTICFAQDAWSRCDVSVGADGTIESSGSGGAAVHVNDYAFVDGSGDYHFYYGMEETLTLFGDYYVYENTDYKTISSEGLDREHIGIRDYYFEADYENRKHYYSYFMIDDNYNDITTDADYEDSNELKKRFAQIGVQTYTKQDMDEMLSERSKEIGYPE